jgi:hypothetical protein
MEATSAPKPFVIKSGIGGHVDPIGREWIGKAIHIASCAWVNPAVLLIIV